MRSLSFLREFVSGFFSTLFLDGREGRHGMVVLWPKRKTTTEVRRTVVRTTGAACVPMAGLIRRNGQVKGRLLLKRAATNALEKYVDDGDQEHRGQHSSRASAEREDADGYGRLYLESKNPTPADFESFARLLMKEFLSEQGKTQGARES